MLLLHALAPLPVATEYFTGPLVIIVSPSTDVAFSFELADYTLV